MERAKTRVTIDDVAKRAKVSISTVSRVLNGLDRVHPATRQRIQAAVVELGYQPSALARGLALNRTHTIGLIVLNVTDPFFSEMVRGVEETAAAAGYSLLIACQPRQAEERRYHQLFTESRVDGLVLVALGVQRSDLDQLVARGFPVAVIQEDLGGDVPTFVVDNYGGGRLLADHLLDHGYRRIAYIAGSNYTPASADRLRGLRDVLAAHDLRIPDDYLVCGNFMSGSGYEPMLQLLDLPQPPEAVFAANDQMACDALRAARERGLRVPDDIAIVGFDDIILASYTTPTLTTVRQPAYEMGRLAIDAVLAASTNGPQPQRVVLPTELMIRESCGCLPQRGTAKGA
jgi:DNA-binding LacI/PurR family transcriptional regulator